MTVIIDAAVFDSRAVGAWSDPTLTWARSINGVEGSSVFADFHETYLREPGSKTLRTRVVSDGTTSAYRSELSGGPNGFGVDHVNRLIDDGDEIWVGFSVLSDPSNDLSNPASDDVIFQFHTSASGAGFQPPCPIGVAGNRFYLDPKSRSSLDALVSGTPHVAGRVDLGAVIPGQWTDFVLHLVCNSTAAGTVEVWRDGLLKYRETSKGLGYNNSVDWQYLKLGVYLPGWSAAAPPNGTQRIWHHAAVRVGDSSSSFLEVAPVGAPVVPLSSAVGVLA